jgi:transketolase N-terminal domain/subunit
MNKTNDIRKMIIETSYAKQSIHIAPSLSIV